MNLNIPVVIVGFALNGLGIVRSLAPLGIRCFILYNDGKDPCISTRFGTKVRVPNIAAEDILPALRRIREETGERPVLFLTNDFTVASISEHREAFADLVRFPLPAHDTVAALLQKDRCRELYRQAGIDQPDTVDLAQGGDDGGLEALHYPCILKASEKPDGYSARFRKAYIVENAGEARAVFASMKGFVENAIVQEWIEGEDTDIYFGLSIVDEAGRATAAFCGQKVNSWPPKFGNTARCVSAPAMQHRVLKNTADFFRSVGLAGYGALEFKRDPRNDRLCVIEPTVFRVDYQAEVATLNGINLPLAYYCLMTGQPAPEMKLSDRPVGWSDPVYMAHLRRARRIASAPRLPPMFDAYWRWNDPAPWLALHWGSALSSAGGALRRLRALMAPA